MSAPMDDRRHRRRRDPARIAGTLAGAAGAAVSLGFGELIDGASESIPSLVIAIGEVVTDYTPGDVVAASIENLGSIQKSVLTGGIIIASLLIGGLLGQFGLRGSRRVTVGGFALFGLIGGWAAARNPISPDLASWLVAFGAAALGAATTLLLVSRAGFVPGRGETPQASDGGSQEPRADTAAQPARVGTRRSFFGYATGAGIASLGLVGIGRALRGESAAEQAREAYTLPSRTSDASSGKGTEASAADAGTTVEAPEGISIDDIEAPEGISIDDIEVPEGIGIDETPDAADTTGEAATPANETPSDQAAAAAEPVDESAPAQPGESSSQQASEPASGAPQTEQATTTTEATTTTTEPQQTTTTTEPPQTTTTTQPPQTTTTTEPPQDLTVPEQAERLDTLDDDVAGISTYITPNDRFYRIDTALAVPHVDPDDWSLRFTGMIDEPYELSFDEILDMPLGKYPITLSCVSNQVGGRLVGNAVWTGIPLAVLLQRAGVQRGASQIVGRSVDDFTAGFPTTAAYDGRNAILAVGMNGELLPIKHGFPARLVIAGLYGYVSAVKWLEEIHLTSWDGFDGYWVPRGWSKRGPMKTQSRIDVPNDGTRLAMGTTTAIAGIAWAPTRGIQRVEVKVGDEDWVACQLGQALGDETWVQWHRAWTPNAARRHQIQVRATDGTGAVQSRGPKSPRPDGAEGWHSISVTVRG